MNFNSLQFLIFLPIVVGLFWLLPHKFRWVLLLAASYYFYMSWDPYLVFLILATTATCYFAAIVIERSENKAARKAWLILALAVCFGILFFFKYFNFLADSVITLLRAFSMDVGDLALALILPVGISFYTFQTLSYVIDVYRGEFKAERHFGYFALYVSFFPQLVAGPIERPGNLLPQLKEARKWEASNFEVGGRWLLSGFFRKCVVADFCGIFVDRVYANIEGANGLALFAAAAIFLVQIYNDFAGYSEIAMGSARLMGVKLTQNFEKPLTSASVTEFFRRWHITLNEWFTQYVYIPLGGNRKGKLRKVVNTLVVFSLCGLWHGANWTFVLWGLTAGIAVGVESVLRKPVKRLAERWSVDLERPIPRLLRQLGVSLLLVLSCAIFRSQSLSEVGTIYVKFITEWGWDKEYVASAMNALGMEPFELIQLLVVIVGMALVYRFPRMGETKNELPMSLMKKENTSVTLAVYVCGTLAVMLFWLGLLAGSDASAFTYFQF